METFRVLECEKMFRKICCVNLVIDLVLISRII